MSSRPARVPSSGPFRADQIREGDLYELSNGHPIHCMGSGDRHAGSNLDGATVIKTDPAVRRAGVDAGHEFNEGRTLRAPDISVGNLTGEPGWVKGPPLLAVEYADRGRDESDLQTKIAELLDAGTKCVWVVRLAGPVRVEVYEPGAACRVVAADGVLTAPGVLENAVPVMALVDPDASNEATLRNLLQRRGYPDLDAVREEGVVEGKAEGMAEGMAEGKAEGMASAVLRVLQSRAIAVDDATRRKVEACTDLATLDRWLQRAVTLDLVERLFAESLSGSGP